MSAASTERAGLLRLTAIACRLCLIALALSGCGQTVLSRSLPVPAFEQLPPLPDTATPTLSPVPPTITLTPSPTITQTATPRIPPDMPLEITFDGVYSHALEFRQSVRNTLEANRALLPDSRLTVSAFRDTDDWAKLTLVSTAFVENGWTHVETVTPIEVIARKVADGVWIAAVVGGGDFGALSGALPRAFVNLDAPIPPLEGEYRFPWASGQSWWAIQGWHGGSAIDFQPGIGARHSVLAAQSGFLREICSDGYQSLLEIAHADGRRTYYLHVTMGLTVRRQLLDQPIRQGQYLGELIRVDYFVTPCGQGMSRHLHFAVSDPSMTIDGYPLEGVAASASCCANPPGYPSTNQRIDAARAEG